MIKAYYWFGINLLSLFFIYLYIYIYINAQTLIESGKLGNDICHGRTNMDFSQLIEIYIYIYIFFFFFLISDSLLSDLFVCRAL